MLLKNSALRTMGTTTSMRRHDTGRYHFSAALSRTLFLYGRNYFVKCGNSFIARLVLGDIAPHRILYLLSNRLGPEPKLRVGGRRLWSLPEIAVVAEKLKIQVGAELERQRLTDG